MSERVDLVQNLWYDNGRWWVTLEGKELDMPTYNFPGTRAGWGEMMEFLATYSYAELARAGVGACQIHGGECRTCPGLERCSMT